MDSSWTLEKRANVRRVIQAVADRMREHLESDLQDDLVTISAAQKKRIKWSLKYIEVYLAADGCILFSGERPTSLGNRILMLTPHIAELLRHYGTDDGTTRARKMLHCPPSHYVTSHDMKTGGPCELVSAPVYFKAGSTTPDDARYDNNIGDGDDNTLAIDPDMYAGPKEFQKAWEAYYKLVEPCSSWTEKRDLECLSMFCINVKEKYIYICIYVYIRDFEIF